MQLLGPIVRLQLQRSPLKLGERGRRQYLPAPIQAVPALIITPDGALTWDEHGTMLDVHHRRHPAGKNDDGAHGLSLLFTPHYRLMQDRFGPHVTDGIAGESILVETDRRIEAGDLHAGVVVETADGKRAHLSLTKVAEPCVEFTRYALRRDPDAPADEPFLDALDFLRGGMRGFYARYDGELLTVRTGDRVFLR